jgi:hypothetical protein
MQEHGEEPKRRLPFLASIRSFKPRDVLPLLSPFRETKEPRSAKGMKDRAEEDGRSEEVKGLNTYPVPQHLP